MARMRSGQINPDSGIQVAVSHQDGEVVIYDNLFAGKSERNQVSRMRFATYGKARLWAAEFEARNRRMKEREA